MVGISCVCHVMYNLDRKEEKKKIAALLNKGNKTKRKRTLM